MQKQQVNQKIKKINNDFSLNGIVSKSLNELLKQLKRKVGKKLGLNSNQLKKLGWGSLLHDIGKLEIADQILKKPGALTELEYKRIKKHPLQGVKILTQNNIISNLKPAILEHHENFDGSGYPFGLAGTEISLFARIIRVADSFDSMTSTRVYKSGIPVKESIIELRNQANQQFDPNIVKSFTEILLN
jgi:HD-GYP domain-containing protein (c-di-GMP phosphodiesterase class II)